MLFDYMSFGSMANKRIYRKLEMKIVKILLIRLTILNTFSFFGYHIRSALFRSFFYKYKDIYNNGSIQDRVARIQTFGISTMNIHCTRIYVLFMNKTSE